MICFLDFETTGIDVFKDYPIEIGAVLVDDNLNIIKKFQSFINPNRKRKFKATAIKTHGYKSMSDLSNFPLSKDVLTDFFETLGSNYCFAGWNISFDVTFFRKLCHQNNMMKRYNELNYRHLDIQSMMHLFNHFKHTEIEKNSLDNTCQYFNIKRSKKHNALEDAKLTLEIYKSIVSVF
jgi:DNA polymerase III epsilon subunit family exonuclease